jgi:hypothetical protein
MVFSSFVSTKDKKSAIFLEKTREKRKRKRREDVLT